MRLSFSLGAKALLLAGGMLLGGSAFAQKPQKKERVDAVDMLFYFAENKNDRSFAFGQEAQKQRERVMQQKHNARSRGVATMLNLYGMISCHEIDSALRHNLNLYQTNTLNITLRGHGKTHWQRENVTRYATHHSIMNDTIQNHDRNDHNTHALWQTIAKATKDSRTEDSKHFITLISCFPASAVIGAGDLHAGTELLILNDAKNFTWDNTAGYLHDMDKEESGKFIPPEHFIESQLYYHNKNKRPFLIFVTGNDGRGDNVTVNGQVFSSGAHRMKVLDFRKEAVRYFPNHKKSDVKRFFADYTATYGYSGGVYGEPNWLNENDLHDTVEAWEKVRNEEDFDTLLTPQQQHIAFVLLYRSVKKTNDILMLPNFVNFYMNELIETVPPVKPKPMTASINPQ